MSKCTIFEQANRYVGALKGGFPTAAKQFKEGIYETIRLAETCEPICVKRTYPLPCCCNTVYLDCGIRLILSDSGDGFEVTIPPLHGVIVIEDSVYYVPNEGYEGEDEFEFIQGGINNKVCIEAVTFSASLDVGELNDDEITLTVQTDCDNPTVSWGEGLPFSAFSIIIPKEGLYAPVVTCGNCFAELDTKYADFYMAGESINGATSYKYNSSPVGLNAPILDHGGEVFSLTKDTSGNYYTVGAIVGGVTTRKYDSAGTELWNNNHGATVNKVAVDSNGDVYIVGSRGAANRVIRKYNSSGTQQWAHSPTNQLDGLHIGTDGNIYAVGSASNNVSVWVYNPAGSLVNSFYAGGITLDVVTDADGNIYTAGWVTEGGTTRKFDSSGNILWQQNHGSIVASIALDSQGNVFTGGYSVGGQSLRKYGNGGNLIWSRNAGGRVWDIAVDANDNVFAAGNLQNNRTTFRFDRGGDLMWTLNQGARVRSILIEG